MKYGMRTPSWRKSLSARTTGRAKRAIKRAIIPGYGRRCMGWLHPKKAIYNRVYRRTTFSIFDLAKAGTGKGASNSGCCVLILVVGLMIALGVMTASAQQIRQGYVDKGNNADSENFHTLLGSWIPGQQLTDDDNFYISRQKPRYRFRNVATQVLQDLVADNDKKLVAWVPVNNPTFNALPDGVFDSEVFTMWPYVTHWGNWTAPLGRIPAAFLDVAHKNGVGVSGVASIPNSRLTATWRDMMEGLYEIGGEKAAKFFHFYGIDGMGYNSEYEDNTDATAHLRSFHYNLVKAAKPNNPLFENIWYDGTNDYGYVSFDCGLGDHNKLTFGDGDSVRTSLFYNYNWNLLDLNYYALNALDMGRNPLDLYAGINMQGGEPNDLPWSMLGESLVSIGLWGAHSYNMWWESRDELGSSEEADQTTYLLRTERYFGGGNRNPANTPAIRNGHQYNALNYDWHGICSFMTARSAMSWDLAEEPLITHFNLGNGKYFNLNGVRQNNNPWYNVGIQDYLPTWHFWFASKLLGRTSADVPAAGLDANFTWDDAYFGGSSLQITGSSADEYLHLFKTKYTLKKGDVIKFKFKLYKGSTDLDLVLSAEGSESDGVSYKLCSANVATDENAWVERTFCVGSDFDGKDLALVALHFRNAENLNLLLGEFSIVRGTYPTPSTPVIAYAQMLHNSMAGMDAKIVFNMPNDKAAGEPCYNQDVNTSYFRLYAQQEGQEPMLMGATSSWAGLYYSIPIVGEPNSKVRLGVSAVSLDQNSESEIAWSDYMSPTDYVYNDDIQKDKTVIKPGEEFTIGYADAHHPAASWQIIDGNGNVVKSGNGNSWTVDGLQTVGNYDLKVMGNVYDENGLAQDSVRTFSSYVQITSNATGAKPEIYALTANGNNDKEVALGVGENVKMAYTGRYADGVCSRGLDLNEKRFGVSVADLGLVGDSSFTISFWLKLNSLKKGQSTCLFNVYDKQDSWPKTDWGWFWSCVDENGGIAPYTFRGVMGSTNRELQYNYNNSSLPVGNWVHISMAFDYNDAGRLRSDLYINGIKQQLTSWQRGDGSLNTTDPGYQNRVYSITNGMYLCIGGPLFQRCGIDGSIDNVIVWNKAINDEEAILAMGNLDADNLPSGVAAFWNFEAEATDCYFPAVGSLAGTKAGIQELVTGANEGQATPRFVAPTYTAGCPFLEDKGYRVVTLPTWTAKNATFADVVGNGEEGSVNASFHKDGYYDVKLTLSNAHGSAERTFSVIKVGDPAGVNTIANTPLKAYTVGENAVIEFADAGDYEVSVFSVDGQLLARKSAYVHDDNIMNVHLPKPDIYVIKIKKDGKTIRSLKLIRN